MTEILRAAGFRRSHWSASEHAAFASHPTLLTDPESVSTIVGAVKSWKNDQESMTGRQQRVSAAEIGRRLSDIWDWADQTKTRKNGGRNRYLTHDDMMKP